MSGEDVRAVVEIAEAAGRTLLEVRNSPDPDAAVRAAGDLAGHRCIIDLLARRFPDDAVLSEEGADDGPGAPGARRWIVDPLDGTREFGERGRTDWAVHVALVEHGALAAGAVALPALGVTYSSADPVPDRPAIPATPRIVVSRTRPPAEAQSVAKAIDGELVPMGSAGAKAMAVVSGAAEVYVHAGGQYVWDSAAPVAVAAAAGLHTSRLDGSALDYTGGSWLPDLLICRRELAQAVLDICRKVAS